MTKSRRYILLALQEGPKKIEEICEATGLKAPTVRYNVRNMVKDGLIETTKKRVFVKQEFRNGGDSALFGGAGAVMREFLIVSLKED